MRNNPPHFLSVCVFIGGTANARIVHDIFIGMPMLTVSVFIPGIDRSGLWTFQKIDGRGSDRIINVINPKHIEKADIETEPPNLDLSKRHLLIKAMVPSAHIGSVGGQMKRLCSRETKVAETNADDPPPYQDM